MSCSSSQKTKPAAPQYEIPIGLWVAALEPYVHRSDATVRVVPIKDQHGIVQAIQLSVCVQNKIVSEMTHLIQKTPHDESVK